MASTKGTTRLVRAAAGRRRTVVQVVFVVLILAISVAHTLEEDGIDVPVLGSASLHAVCPFGGVVTLYQLATTGTLTRKIHESALVLMWTVLGLAILVGPVFCGWGCPFGSIQEWIGRIGGKLFKKRYNAFIPYRFDRILRYLRYGVLAWVIYMTAATGQLVFADIDPYFTLFNLWSEEIAVGGIIVLVVVVILSLFVERPFCKYACPYGAVLGVTNLFRVFSIRRNAKTCIDCGVCDRSCPMNIPVSSSTIVRNHQCITCMKCASEQACPVGDTVELRLGRFEQPTPTAGSGAADLKNERRERKS